MGPSCRSDSVYFLVFSSGDCSNPVRISWGCCLLVAICILQHYLPWHLDGPEKVRVLFPSEPLIQCDLEHVLHHLCHHWSQHSDRRNQTSAHQMEQKMPSIKMIHCTNTRLCLICLWAQTSGRCLQVFPLYVPSLAAPFVIVVISWLHKELFPPGCRDDSMGLPEVFCMLPAIPQRHFAAPFYRLWGLGQGCPPCVFV